MGNCQNYGPFLGPYYNTGPNTGPNLGDLKGDHNFDNSPHTLDCLAEVDGVQRVSPVSIAQRAAWSLLVFITLPGPQKYVK